MTLTNKRVHEHGFLAAMLNDSHYPAELVRAGQGLIFALAERIERRQPVGDAIYVLTHETTCQFNELQKTFRERGSDIETTARDAITEDIEFVLEAYGYDVDLDQALATREW